MFELNVLSAHLKQGLLQHITHMDSRQCHTFSLYMGFFIVDTQHKALAICICSITNILYRTNDVFLYSFSQYNEMNSMNIWWFFPKKNQSTLTVNLCTRFFFSYLISVCRNCHCSCCKWCFLTKLRSGAVVVWLGVQFRPSPGRSVWLGRLWRHLVETE